MLGNKHTPVMEYSPSPPRLNRNNRPDNLSTPTSMPCVERSTTCLNYKAVCLHQTPILRLEGWGGGGVSFDMDPNKLLPTLHHLLYPERTVVFQPSQNSTEYQTFTSKHPRLYPQPICFAPFKNRKPIANGTPLFIHDLPVKPIKVIPLPSHRYYFQTCTVENNDQSNWCIHHKQKRYSCKIHNYGGMFPPSNRRNQYCCRQYTLYTTFLLLLLLPLRWWSVLDHTECIVVIYRRYSLCILKCYGQFANASRPANYAGYPSAIGCT